MSFRIAYVLGLTVAGAALVACGSSPGAATTQAPTYAPSTPDGMPPIRTSPFPAVSVDPNDPTAAACSADVARVIDATERYNQVKGVYADSMEKLVKAGLLKNVPADVAYHYEAPDIDPLVLGTVTGC